MIKSIQGHHPELAEDVWIAENATIIGRVKIGRKSSVWYNAVLRGDVVDIVIGERTNIQDGVIIHGSTGRTPVIIGDDNVIGHRAILHGCTIENECLIGMGAIVLDGAVVPTHTIVAAGALVRENMILESGLLYAGVPAKKIKAISPQAIQMIKLGAAHYVDNAHVHASGEILDGNFGA